MSVSYQANRFYDKRPAAQEALHDEATKDRLDLWYSALLRVGRELLY